MTERTEKEKEISLEWCKHGVVLTNKEIANISKEEESKAEKNKESE